MKTLLILFTFILSGFCLGFATKITDPCDQVDYDWLNSHSPIPANSTLISKQPVNGLCEVILQYRDEYIPIYAGSDYLIAGEMIRDRVQVTQARLAELQKVRFKNLIPELADLTAITYAPEHAEKDIYIISSPSCPHCKRLAADIKDIADIYNTRVNVILYPLVSVESDDEKCIEAVCRNYDLDRYVKGEWTVMPDESVRCEDGERLISRTRTLLQAAGVHQVPVTIMPDGSYVIGPDIDTISDLIVRS